MYTSFFKDPPCNVHPSSWLWSVLYVILEVMACSDDVQTKFKRGSASNLVVEGTTFVIYDLATGKVQHLKKFSVMFFVLATPVH